MTTRAVRVFAVCAVFLGCLHAQTLRELKTKYINSKVFAMPRYTSSSGTVDGFDLADKKAVKKGVYESTSAGLPKSYLGIPAVVIDVRFTQYAPDRLHGNDKHQQNALGETTSDEDKDISRKSIEAVLRFDDGTVALHSEVYSKDLADLIGVRSEFRNIQLAVTRERHAKMFASEQAGLIGRVL